MVEEVAKNIYKIEVTLPNNPLRYLNSYFLKGEGNDPNYLIDTGFNRQDCYDDLISGLKEINANLDNLNIINTHFHSDHSGLNTALLNGTGKAYMGRIDLGHLSDYYLRKTIKQPGPGDLRYLCEGVTFKECRRMGKSDPSKLFADEVIDDRMVPVDDGFILHAAGRDLKFVLVPGHTPGNCMLWSEKDGLMFTGDHVLFDISPNIVSWFDLPNSLESYLQSLRKAKKFNVKLALPGHRKPGDYQDRVDWLIGHHERRLNKCLDIINNEEKPLTAWEITSRMSWKIKAASWEEFPDAQKWFAMGECLAHLDCLLYRNLIKKSANDNYFVYEPLEV